MNHKACKLAVTIIPALACHPATAADYLPLHCAKAATATEKTVCSDYGLGQAEARMASLYQWATSFVAMGQRGSLQDEQAAFIKKRENCGTDAKCIRDAYRARIETLETVMESVKRHGPF